MDLPDVASEISAKCKVCPEGWHWGADPEDAVFEVSRDDEGGTFLGAKSESEEVVRIRQRGEDLVEEFVGKLEQREGWEGRHDVVMPQHEEGQSQAVAPIVDHDPNHSHVLMR